MVRTVLSDIRRKIAVAQTGKAPLLTADIRRLCAAASEDEAGIQEWALILLGYAGGFRRSELVALDWDAIQFTPEGLEIVLRRSKTDQDGAGRTIGIPFGSNPITCPVRAMSSPRDVAITLVGPVFRRADAASRLLPKRLG